jgi:hypothetical protein
MVMRMPSAFLHLKITVGLVVLLGLWTVKLYADWVARGPVGSADMIRSAGANGRTGLTPPRPAEFLAIVQRALKARKKEDGIYEGIEITSVTVKDEILTLEGTMTRERHRVDAREIAFEALTRAGVRIKDEGHNDHHSLKKIGTFAPDDTP